MFDTILGQDRAVEYLKRACNSGRIHHAYLFLGEEGVGRKYSAKIFAAFLNCREKDKPCGYCSSCMKVLKGIHPDVKVVLPDGQSIKIEQIRAIINEIYMRPYEGKKKVYIIDEASSMTLQAQNAFLKTLEEPAQDSVIILISNTTKGLLPTILSRTVILKFGNIDIRAIEKYLIERLNIEENKSKLIARFSKGSIGKAINLANSEFLNFREEVIGTIYGILTTDNYEAIGYYSFFEKNKDRMEDILDLISTWFRDFIIYAETGDDSAIFNIDCIQGFAELLRRGIKPIRDYLEVIKKAKYSLLHNVNFQTFVFSMLLELEEVKNRWSR